jgi:hypothetical protein
LSHLDRNLDALIQELAARCQRIFVRAASASARSAVVSRAPEAIQDADTRPGPQYPKGSIVRYRITEETNEVGTTARWPNMSSPGYYIDWQLLAISGDACHFCGPGVQ